MFSVEDYLRNIMWKYMSAFAKFRCWVAPICIETGRYEGMDEKGRICLLCDHKIDSEYHVHSEKSLARSMLFYSRNYEQQNWVQFVLNVQYVHWRPLVATVA